MLTRLEVRYETEDQIDPVAQAKLSRLIREFVVDYLEIAGLPPLWTALDVIEPRSRLCDMEESALTSP